MQVIKTFLTPNRKSLFKNYFLIVVGSILLAVGTGIFLLPAELNTGGLMGLGLIFHSTIGLDPDLVVLILTWVLFGVSLLILGWRFTVKTLVSSIIYPLILVGLMRIPVIIDYSTMLFTGADTATKLLAGIFGGVFCGVGVAFTFIGGGSTGGVDILVMIIVKYVRISHSTLAFIADGAIIFIGLFVLQDVIATLIGVLSAFTFAVMIEFVFVGRSHALSAHIISPTKFEDINKWLQTATGRGTTLIPVLGGYKQDEYTMIIVNFNRREYAQIINGIAKIDKRAFVTVHQTSAVLGEGFKTITPSKTINFKGKKNKDVK